MTTHPGGDFGLALDVQTLLIIASWIAALLGLFLLLAWISDRSIRALAWWSAAYFIGGSAIASLLSGATTTIPVAREVPAALLFLALGMIWSGARLFYGRRVRPVALVAGAVIWFMMVKLPLFAEPGAARLALNATGISIYTFLTAIEIWRDRRSRPYPRFQAIVMPLLHAGVFLYPVLLPAIMPWSIDSGVSGPWATELTLVTVLYGVGMAFLILALVHDYKIRIHKDAASTDSLTGLFNRRAFLESAQELIDRCAGKRQPVTLLMFDLDYFKTVNDRFGHAVGDDALRLFAKTASESMRVDDIIGRLGGEEFAAVVPGDDDVAVGIAERIRAAFEAVGTEVCGHPVKATVSIGAAWTNDKVSVEKILAAADVALYRAKETGRNRLVLADDRVRGAAPDNAPAGTEVVDRTHRRPRWVIGLQVWPAGRWLLQTYRGLVGTFIWVMQCGERRLVIRRDVWPAALRTSRQAVEVRRRPVA
jgi:diguanylate cyclase (GGDEF)-like protein